MEALLVSASMVALAEMGDKTQLATAALTAHYSDVYLVVLGAALGMMLANAPSSFWASGSSRKIPMRTVRLLTTVLFLALGSMALLNIGSAVTSPMQKSAYCAAKPAKNEINSYIMYSFGQLSK